MKRYTYSCSYCTVTVTQSWRHIMTLEKSNYLIEKIVYLGHVLRPWKLELADHTTDEFGDFNPSHNVMEWKLFPGLCNVYRGFVPNFAHIAAVLNNKLKKGERRTLDSGTQEEHDALASSQNELVSAPLLLSPHTRGLLTLDMDAWNKQSGCVLIQEQHTERISHFASDTRCWTLLTRTSINHIEGAWL